MSDILSKRAKTQAIKYGVPFVMLIIGGSFALKEFSQLRYQFSRNKAMTREEIEELSGVQMKDKEEVTIEKLYEEVKQLDIDHWESVRLPRPWEEPSSKDQK
uniref:Cytochrome c oxidase assembly protein COX16 homolog, mitochondrial n=1 Tax=Culicoides sonorensis TaxID=179676 RepID=A0A336LHM2_CULSO